MIYHVTLCLQTVNSKAEENYHNYKESNEAFPMHANHLANEGLLMVAVKHTRYC